MFNCNLDITHVGLDQGETPASREGLTENLQAKTYSLKVQISQTSHFFFGYQSLPGPSADPPGVSYGAKPRRVIADPGHILTLTDPLLRHQLAA